MKVEARFTLYREAGTYASFPSLCARPDGGLWLAFRRAPDHRVLQPHAAGFDDVDHLDARSHIALLALDRSGAPHGAIRVVPPDTAACDQDPNLLRLRDGRVLLTGFGYYPLPSVLAAPLVEEGALAMRLRESDIAYFFWGGYARHSDDDGASWSPHGFLPAATFRPPVVPGVRAWHGGAIRGRAVELADGTVLQAAYAGNRDTNWCLASELWATTDRGATWTRRGNIAFDPKGEIGFCETGLVLLPDGTLLALHRTTGVGGRIATSRSRDGGTSWEDARVHHPVGHPCDACVLADGRVLVVFGYRSRPFGLRACFWRDDALQDEMVLVDDVPSPDLGYPWVEPLADGGALAAFYCADRDGVRGIEAVRLR